MLEEILEGGFGGVVVLEVFLIDLADGEEGIGAVLAAGILLAEEFVLGDGVFEELVVLKGAALFGEQSSATATILASASPEAGR